jgi:S-adenosylmethionine/arginine decarboxylase-like enzyme
LNELTRLENVILQRESHLSIHGFLGYFEIGLAMVGGNTTREYLEQYLRPAEVLEHQLVLFDQLLSACRSLR